MFVRFWLLYIHLHLTNLTKGHVSCESQLIRIRCLLDCLIVIYTPTSNQSRTGWRQLWKSINQNEIFVRFWLLYIHLHLTNPTKGHVSCESQLIIIKCLLDCLIVIYTPTSIPSHKGSRQLSYFLLSNQRRAYTILRH